MKKAALHILLILILTIGYGGSLKAQSCTGCTHSIPNGGGNITVGNGDVYCLSTGNTFTGKLISLAAGGTICIEAGAIFTPNNNDMTSFSGTIINRGTMSFTRYNSHNVTIINYGTFTTTGWQNFEGYMENRGTVNLNGYVSLPSSSEINSYGIFNANNGGTFNGTIDNSGTMKFYGINLNGVLNNYNQMYFYNSLNVGAGTYVTNDYEAYLETQNISGIQFNGPMLTNNGTIKVKSNSNSAQFKMNQSINQVFNNGLIEVEGDFEQNASNSLLVNNCRIISRDFKIQSGVAKNNGLISISGSFKNSGTECHLTNGATGRIQGVNFTNSGYVNGSGEFYFTGTTTNSVNNNSNMFVGTSASEPLRFYDATLANGYTIFDNLQTSNPWNMPVNTIYPTSMTPMDTTSFDCSAIPVSGAGFLPNTDTVSRTYCTPPASLNFDLHNYVSAYDNTCTIQWSTIKLFEYNNPDNTTNNTTNLIIANKGVFSANTTTGIITFTPDSAFTSGSVTAQYRIANTKAGDPIVYPSLKTDIMITRSCNNDYTPATSTIDTTFCGADSVLLNMNNYINAHAPVDGFSFSLQWNTLKLFDPTNPNNPGNGTNSIHIANTGTFTIIQTNPGKVSFYPDNGFTGTATAEYQISNIWSKNNTSYTSDKMNISVHGSNIPAPNIDSAQTF